MRREPIQPVEPKPGPIATGSHLGQTIDPAYGFTFGRFHVCCLNSRGASSLLGVEIAEEKAVTVIRVQAPSTGYRFVWDEEHYRLKLVAPASGTVTGRAFVEVYAVFDRTVSMKEIAV
ncbi:hypothetical protein EON81_06915 [bacterium]|nr:MAG: hypothetical protein EON81_06915 [bacterium]